MKNLREVSKLKTKREEKLEKKEELEKELEELRNKINDLDDEIAKMEGAPEKMEDIREEAENFIKNKKKRPRQSYGKYFINRKQEECTEKRQKRNQVLQEDIEEKRDFEESEQEILKDT